jgi:uncharacterized membrane protein (GlpM family)
MIRGPSQRSRRPADAIRLSPADLKQPKTKDWLIRFAFGAGVSGIAAIVAKLFGPQIGGLLLAFPAILLASLTLVAKDDGPKQARNDARGACLGALGLIAFALVGAMMMHRWPSWAALMAATAAWAVVAFGGYVIVRRLGAGSDD